MIVFPNPGHSFIYRSCNFTVCIKYVQADCSRHQLVKISIYTSPARHPSEHDGDCILLSQDLKFSLKEEHALHDTSWPDSWKFHENSRGWLRTFLECAPWATASSSRFHYWAKLLPLWICSIAQLEKRVLWMYSYLHNGKRQSFLVNECYQ